MIEASDFNSPVAASGTSIRHFRGKTKPLDTSQQTNKQIRIGKNIVGKTQLPAVSAISGLCKMLNYKLQEHPKIWGRITYIVESLMPLRHFAEQVVMCRRSLKQTLKKYNSLVLMPSSAKTLRFWTVGTKSSQGTSQHQPASSHRPFACFRTSDTSTGFLACNRAKCGSQQN